MRTEANGTITYFPLDYPESEVAVAWYAELPLNTGNVMGMVFRDGPHDPWKVVVRTRLYMDDLTNDDSKDRRRGYMATSTETDPETARASLVETTEGLFAEITKHGGTLTRLAGHTTLAEFMDSWAQQPWAHGRTLTAEEAARYAKK